jgi:hypothetical protein
MDTPKTRALDPKGLTLLLVGKLESRSLRWRQPLLLVVALSPIWLSLCVSVTHAQQYGIEVKRGNNIDEKVQIARAVVTDERLSRLKAQLKERTPGLSTATLNGMGLRWNQTQIRPLNGGEPQTAVFVYVSIPSQQGVDGKAVVEAAARLLEPEINGDKTATRPVPR